MTRKTHQLTDNPLWKQANAIGEYMYSTVIKQFGNFTTEKWNSESKIRQSTTDLMFWVGEAVGSSLPDATVFEWNTARKSLSGLQTMYNFAGKQGFIKLEPSMIAKMDKLRVKIDEQLANCQEDIVQKNKAELEPWLEKHRLWKEMQGNNA